CAVVAEELALTEKVLAWAAARAGARAADCGAHRQRGFPDGASWLAQRSGTSAGAARAAMDATAAVGGLPSTQAALNRGEVSLAQAAEIAKAEAAQPGSEQEMLELSRNRTVSALKEEARKRRARAIDPEELRRRQQASQELR